MTDLYQLRPISPQFNSNLEALRHYSIQLESLASSLSLSIEEAVEAAESSFIHCETLNKILFLSGRVDFFKKLTKVS